jgi:hypothetical protein
MATLALWRLAAGTAARSRVAAAVRLPTRNTSHGNVHIFRTVDDAVRDIPSGARVRGDCSVSLLQQQSHSDARRPHRS